MYACQSYLPSATTNMNNNVLTDKSLMKTTRLLVGAFNN